MTEIIEKNRFPRKSIKHGKLQEKILKNLSEPKTMNELRKTLEIPRTTLIYHLRTLERMKKIFTMTYHTEHRGKPGFLYALKESDRN